MTIGMPPLLNSVANAVNTVSLLVSDAQILMSGLSGPKWGIALNGVMQIVPDSIVSLEYKRDWQIPNYRQEAGAFQSYNKVATPYDAKIRMTKGGTDADRYDFLDAIDFAAESLNLYDIVTPDQTYNSANIVHYDYRRTSTNGVSLLTVDISLIEVRVNATATFSNTVAPSGADPVNGGSVQAASVGGAQTSGVMGAISGAASSASGAVSSSISSIASNVSGAASSVSSGISTASSAASSAFK